LRLRHSAGELSDGGGLLLLRQLWDRLGLGERIDTEAAWLRGQYRPSLMVELWIVLLLCGSTTRVRSWSSASRSWDSSR
jgi:hypothetical protein